MNPKFFRRTSKNLKKIEKFDLRYKDRGEKNEKSNQRSPGAENLKFEEKESKYNLYWGLKSGTYSLL